MATRALAVAAALAACSPEILERPQAQYADLKSLEPHATIDAGHASATAKEREIATHYLAALAQTGFADLPALFGDEAHSTFAGVADAYTRADIVKLHETMFGAYEPRTFTPTRILITDSAQAIEWTLVATDKQAQRQTAVRGVSLLVTTDDGTIREEHVYFDKLVLDGKVPNAPTITPAASPEIVEQQSTPAEQKNLELVQIVLDDHLEKDESKYAAAFAADAEVFTAEDAQPLRGQAGAHAYWKLLQQTFANLQSTFVSGQGVDGYVFVEYYIVGEQRRKFGLIPIPANPLVKLNIVSVIQLRGGKISRVWRYDNPFQIISVRTP